MNYTPTTPELCTLLAALRMYQDRMIGERPGDDYADIASLGGTLTPLDADDIDALCTRLNTVPVGIPETIPFRTAFLRVFGLLLEEGFSQLSCGLEGYEGDGEDDAECIELLDADLSNAIGTVFTTLGFPEFTPEDEGTAGDWLREHNPEIFTLRDEAADARDNADQIEFGNSIISS